MKIAVVTSGMGEQSALVISQVADALAAADGETEIVIVELRNYITELASALTSFAPGRLRGVFETVAHADGVVIHTSIMNASFSGLIKVFLDVLPEGTLAGMPVLMVGTGGTPRHSLVLDYALRPVLTYLHAEVLSITTFVATSDWGADGDGVRSVGERITDAARRLVVAAGGTLGRTLGRQKRADAVSPMGSFDVSGITDRLKNL